MQSWALRQPSRGIEARLFGVEGGVSSIEARKPALHLPWWQTLGASAVACAALLITLLNVAQFSTGGPAGAGILSLSNRSCAVSLAMASAPVNRLSAPILGWTNDGALGTTHRSFDLLNTNRLLH